MSTTMFLGSQAGIPAAPAAQAAQAQQLVDAAIAAQASADRATDQLDAYEEATTHAVMELRVVVWSLQAKMQGIEPLPSFSPSTAPLADLRATIASLRDLVQSMQAATLSRRTRPRSSFGTGTSE